MTMTAKRLLLATAAATTFALGGCGSTHEVRNPVSGQTERTVMDESAEIATGAKEHAEILKEYGVVADRNLQAYVNSVGQRLAAQSHRANLKWTFTVLDSPQVNAFALPGGYVYITRGIMAYLDSEADLAGVLGHEIGHVTARHSAQRATRAQRASVGGLLGTLAGVALEVAGVQGAAQAAGQLSQAAAAGYVARYSRDQELQADQLGAEYLARSSYDPNNMVDVIRVLLDQERFAADAARAAGRAPSSAPNWLSSHPTSEQRLNDIRATTAKLAASRAAWSDDGRARYLRAVDGMAFGDSREQGVVRGRNFYHEDLGIAVTVPPGWRIQNEADKLTMINAEGDAAVIMKGPLPADAGTDHETILRRSLGAVDGRTERLTLGGSLPATHFSGAVRNAQGQTANIEATLVTAPGNRVFLLQWAGRDAATLQRNRGAMRDVVTSFRPLGNADRAQARPWRLRTVAMPNGGFAELARYSPLGERAEAHLRLLNGAYDQNSRGPRPGEPVKVVE